MLSKRALQAFREKRQLIERIHKSSLWPLVEEFAAGRKSIEQGYRYILEALLHFMRKREERKVVQPKLAVVGTLWDISEKIAHRQRKIKICALDLIRHVMAQISDCLCRRLTY